MFTDGAINIFLLDMGSFCKNKFGLFKYHLKNYIQYLFSWLNLKFRFFRVYIIVSKDEFAGTFDSDVANPLLVTEIATELVITRLYLIDQLNAGRLRDDCIIVCAEERRFLYTNLFENVVTYQKFKKLNIPKKNIIDLLGVRFFERLAGGKVKNRLIPYLPFYRNWDRDKFAIRNIEEVNMDHLDLSKPFVVLVIRMRGAWPDKNLPEEFWRALISLMSDSKVPVLVFGKGAEIYCNGTNVTYISTLQEWCLVAQSPNLRHVGSTMTGGVYPVMTFGNANTKVTLIDNLNLMKIHSGDPSFYDSCVNFSGCTIKYLQVIPTVQEWFDVLTENL